MADRDEQAQRALAVAAEVCWKAAVRSTSADGAVSTYVLPAGVVHRLVGALQGAGVDAALRVQEQ